MDFFDVWTAYRPKLKPDPDALKPFVTASVVRALTSPSPAELEVFGNWVHDENFNSAQTRTLTGCPLPEIYLKHASAHQLASLRSRDAYWVFGLACRLSPTLGEAVKAIYLRKVPPEAFGSSLPPALLRISWNGARDHQDTATLRLSQNGTCWTRFTLPPASESIMRLGLAVAPHPATFQFNGAIARPVDEPHSGWAQPCELKDREGRTVGSSVPLAQDEEYFLELADLRPGEKDLGFQLDIFLAAHLRA